MTGATVMAQSIQIFIQVALLSCLVTTSMGGITDWEKAFSLLEKKVNVQQEEIKSLHKLVEQLEKRLEPLEVKGEFGEVQICTTYCPYSSCLVFRNIADYGVNGYTSLYDVTLC